jgi:hypothetical protein
MDAVISVDADGNDDFQEWLEALLAVFNVPSNVAGHPDICKDWSVQGKAYGLTKPTDNRPR